ncbi:MAG: sigma-70 family RNA polymerase sigma factor [Rhizobiales bacterium]|nr:sigma-70 family RNA polymerase sigma factor [Hyphomicrobiales bacterium]
MTGQTELRTEENDVDERQRQRAAASELSRLIQRIALGDRAAFDRLYARTSAKLFGVCLRILNDRSEAEEVLQDTFIKIWRRADGYAVTDLSPITWLVAVARHQAIDRLRRRKPHTAELADAVTIVDERQPDPEALAIATGEIQMLDRCLGELEENRAAAVRGAYLDGLSYAELARRHEVPLNTMRTWLRRSLMKLKDCLRR